jgi:transaldolase/glucose-6-phosphate isomerase
MASVTRQLELEGVKSFSDSYTSLIKTTEEKVARLRAENGGGGKAAATTAGGTMKESLSLGASLQTAVNTALAHAEEDRFVTRIWEKDPDLWKPPTADQSEITDRLGWLTVTDVMREALPRLNALRDEVRSNGITHVVLLGMGGSSLAPEVLRETFGTSAGQPELLVLDSTDPATVLSVEKAAHLAHTLFIVASKSGGTIETLSQFKYFFAKDGKRRRPAGRISLHGHNRSRYQAGEAGHR